MGRAVTKSGTGMWDAGIEDTGTRGCGDVAMRGLRDLGTRKRWYLGTWDVGTRGRHKQTTPDFCAAFVKYNFRCS